MKIVVENAKPRAKWLNDLLRAKRSERHSDPRKPSRCQRKIAGRREVSEALG
jgi:hypothetical protein